MDLRELVRALPDKVVGHKPVTETLNVKKEIKRFEKDPVEGLIDRIQDKDSLFIFDDVGKYIQAFSWYKLSLKRCLEHISIARRADSELRYHPRNQKYSNRQKQIAERYKTIAPYLEIDYKNMIIYTCILLDRVIGISRRFLHCSTLPSFTSFNKHINFFEKHRGTLVDEYKKYGEKIVECNSWYKIPIKVLRDKYLMHSSEKHVSFFGWTETSWDLEMITVISANPIQEELLKKVKIISFSPRRLARDVEKFLTWFAVYGENKINPTIG